MSGALAMTLCHAGETWPWETQRITWTEAESLETWPSLGRLITSFHVTRRPTAVLRKSMFFQLSIACVCQKKKRKEEY